MPIDNPETVGGLGGVIAALVASMLALVKSSGSKEVIGPTAEDIAIAMSKTNAPLTEAINRLANELGKFRDENKVDMDRLRDQMHELSEKMLSQYHDITVRILDQQRGN